MEPMHRTRLPGRHRRVSGDGQDGCNRIHKGDSLFRLDGISTDVLCRECANQGVLGRTTAFLQALLHGHVRDVAAHVKGKGQTASGTESLHANVVSLGIQSNSGGMLSIWEITWLAWAMFPHTSLATMVLTYWIPHSTTTVSTDSDTKTSAHASSTTMGDKPQGWDNSR